MINKLRNALAALGHWTIEIIKRSDAIKGFKLLPRRWAVERSNAPSPGCFMMRHLRATEPFDGWLSHLPRQSVAREPEMPTQFAGHDAQITL